MEGTAGVIQQFSSPTEINAPRGCAVILRRICQLSLTRITHQVSRAFDLNLCIQRMVLVEKLAECRGKYHNYAKYRKSM